MAAARCAGRHAAGGACDGATRVRIGSIAPGYDADIIAVRGNPSEQPVSLRQVSFVMKGGTVYKDTVSAAGQRGGDRPAVALRDRSRVH